MSKVQVRILPWDPWSGKFFTTHEVRKGQGKGNEWEPNESPERCLILVDVVVMGEEGAGVAVETKGEDQAEGEDLVLKKTGAFIILTWQLVAQSSLSLKRDHFMKWS